jgi:hypothetical protein
MAWDMVSETTLTYYLLSPMAIYFEQTLLPETKETCTNLVMLRCHSRRPALVPAEHFSHRLKNPGASMVLNSFSDTLHIPLHKSQSEEMVFSTHRRGTLRFSACRASGSSRRNGLSFTISLVSFLNAISV